MLAMYEELGLLEELRIPREVLKKFLVRFAVHTCVWLEEGTVCTVHATKRDFLYKGLLIHKDFRAVPPFELMRD